MSNGNGRRTDVALTINGKDVQAEKGRLLIDVAEELGIFVPRFCYHPGMKSVAVCRMCLVHVEGARKLLPACATPVDEGMKVDTVQPDAVDAQRSMLEFLLINHPLDCPICDRGGECPLQDQTYKHGPGSTRYAEPKRTFEKPLEISELVVLDRERCVLCWRCVRFADEIAGDQFIHLVDRGPGTQILTFKDEPFDSYFSGNTIQICPVGALTSKPYRFVSRPWNLTTAPSVCAYCSVGCPLTNESRSGKLVRCQALPNENVNDFWICDKGRFGYHYVDSKERLTTPLIRRGDEFESATWGEAERVLTEKLTEVQTAAVVSGGHLTTEDAFAISKLGRDALKTGDIDSRIQDVGAPYELFARLGVVGSTATLNDVESAGTLIWVGPDPKETLPVLFLRLRKAVCDGAAKLIVVSPRRLSLDVFATQVIRSDAGGEAAAVRGLLGNSGRRSTAAADIGEDTVVCWGPAAPGRDETPLVQALIDLVVERECKVLVCPPHAGSQGMLDMGVHPALKPGYEPVEEPGKDTRAILESAAAGELDALVIFGADLIADFPDADLAERALRGSRFTVVVELFATETARHADVVLPSASYAERRGTFTNLERRLQKLEPLLPTAGASTEPWRAAQTIARAAGTDFGWRTWEDVWAAIKSDVATHADIDPHRLDQPSPPTVEHYESPFDVHRTTETVAGPGGGYPKGYRSGAPFQTGQNWPLSWELRAFEARQRPGVIPSPAGSAVGEGENGAATAGVSAPAGVPEGGHAPPSPPASDGRLLLYTGRFLYDEGAMVSRSAALRGIAKRPFVELAPSDADERGISDGEEVLVTAGDVSERLVVVVSDIAPGAVFLPYDQPGLRANRLISGVDPSVEVRKA